MNSYNKNLPLVSLQNIQKSFGSLEVLHDISLDLYTGELVTILGPSGGGKTTIFNIISGALKEDSGLAEINGSIGYMQQKDLLLPWKTIDENIALPLEIKKISKDAIHKKIAKYMPIIGLEGYGDKYPYQLSGGMRQRASFLRTIISGEDIMLLDEAFGSLDSITKSTMHEWLLDTMQSLETTILLITHDIDEALLLSDRIYVLSDKPAIIKKEIVVDFNSKDKLERRFSEETLVLKKDILNLL